MARSPRCRTAFFLAMMAFSTSAVAAPPSRVTGWVLARDTPILLDFWHAPLDHFSSVPNARSGADGAFEAARLAPGTYRLKVRKEGFAPAETIVAVRSGETTEIAIPLTPVG